MAAIFYVIGEFLLFLSFNTRIKGWLIVIIALLISLMLPHTADLITYKESFNYPLIYEPGFALSVKTLSAFVPNFNLIISCFQVMLAVVFFVGLKQERSNQSLANIALLSLFGLGAFMSAHNGLRQGFAAAFFMIGFLGKSPKYLFYLLAISFHYSATLLIILELIFAAKIKVKIYSLIIFSVVFPLLFSLGQKYAMYLQFDVANSPERINPIVKLLILLPLFLSTNSFVKNAKLRRLRFSLLILLLISASSPAFSELFARINMYYWIVEMYILLNISSLPRNALLFTYLLAPNALKLYL